MRSLERALDVLEVLENARTPLRLSEVARRAGLHVATAQRILTVLEKRGRVEHDDMTYRTGVAMLFGANAYLATNPLAQTAHPVLQELAAGTGRTASLCIRTGWSRAVIARVEGSRPLRYELPIGDRLPLYLGAGKVLAADMTRDELKQLLDEAGPIMAADGRRITRKGFMAEIASIRQRGYGFSCSERVPGMASVAAPVPRPDGRYAGAVQVSAFAEDLPEQEVESLSAEVRRAASAISQRLS
jgi:DNA-binding IclR family transcriptional regulator